MIGASLAIGGKDDDSVSWLETVNGSFVWSCARSAKAGEVKCVPLTGLVVDGALWREVLEAARVRINFGLAEYGKRRT